MIQFLNASKLVTLPSTPQLVSFDFSAYFSVSLVDFLCFNVDLTLGPLMSLSCAYFDGITEGTRFYEMLLCTTLFKLFRQGFRLHASMVKLWPNVFIWLDYPSIEKAFLITQKESLTFFFSLLYLDCQVYPYIRKKPEGVIQGDRDL